MVGQRKSSPADATHLKKVRKPLIEKKRRDRINNSLTQLKTLLTQNITHHGSMVSRMDKADILEMAVRHLTHLQQRQKSNDHTTLLHGYSRGFKECTRETMRHLRFSETLDNERLCQLNGHLFGVYMTKTQNLTAMPIDSANSANIKDTERSKCAEELPCSDVVTIGNHDIDNIKQNMISVNVGPILKDEVVWRPW